MEKRLSRARTNLDDCSCNLSDLTIASEPQVSTAVMPREEAHTAFQLGVRSEMQSLGKALALAHERDVVSDPILRRDPRETC